MNNEALILMLAAFITVAGFTLFFFWKVMKTPEEHHKAIKDA